MSKPLSVRLDALEEFWDAEPLRMGEPDARGWRAWVDEGKLESSVSHSSQQPPAMDVDTVRDPYTYWAVNEEHCDASSSMPKRADDAGDDPYATVLFSDVRHLLMEITMPEAKHAFRIAWLQFLGLHIPGFVESLDEYSSDAGYDDTWSRAHLKRQSYLQQLFPSQGKVKGKGKEWDAYAGTIIAREKTYGSTFSCIKEWGLGVFDVLEGTRAGDGRLWEDIDVSGIDRELVRCAPTVDGYRVY
jgi:nuclear exosome regulator NRDE2